MPKQILSADWYKIQSQGLSLDTTVTGNGTGTAEVQDNMMVVKLTTVTDAKRNYTTVNTPFSFKILEAVVYSATATTAETHFVGIRNGTDVIASNAQLGTIDYLSYITDLDNTYTSFVKGDNDLVVTLSGSSIGTAVAVIQFAYV